MSEINDQNYHDETFDMEDEGFNNDDTQDDGSLENDSEDNSAQSNEADTQDDGSTEDTESTDSADDTQGDGSVDNDKVRFQYWQSEAYRAQQRELAQAQRIQELESQMQQISKPAEQEDKIPVKPDTDDPDELAAYSAEVSEFLLRREQKREAERLEAEQKKQQAERERLNRDYVLGRMTEVTNNPQKSQRILQFFANTKSLEDPAVFNVMYDAAQAYLTGKPNGANDKNQGAKGTAGGKPPLPPTGGGAAETGGNDKTPDDMFNDSLGEQDRFRL